MILTVMIGILPITLLAAGSAPAAVDIESLAADVLSDSRYQRELPDGSESGFQIPLFGASSLVSALAIAGLLFGAGLLIAWITGRVYGRRQEATSPGVRPAGSPGGHRGAPGIDPASLAAEGQFDEAIHALLLRAVGHLLREADQEPGPAATLREISRDLSLGEERSQALRHLVRQVEMALFGGRAVSPADYAACLKSFDLLVPAMRA